MYWKSLTIDLWFVVSCPEIRYELKLKPKPQVVPPLPKPDPALIDEYAELRERMKAWKPNVNPHAARYAEVSALILAAYETWPASEPIVAEGARYKLPVSARRLERKIIDLAAFFKRIGRERYLEICKPTLGAIEKEIPKEKLGLYIEGKETGPRQIGEPVQKEVIEKRAAALPWSRCGRVTSRPSATIQPRARSGAVRQRPNA